MYIATVIRPDTSHPVVANVKTVSDYGGKIIDLVKLTPEQQIACKKSMEKLIKLSPTFKWMNAELLQQSILDGSIPVREIPAGRVVIREWDGDCNNFFVLAHGILLVSQQKEVIAVLDKIGSFWTMGYLHDSTRNSTILTKTRAVILELRREFVEKTLPPAEQIKLLKNIAIETSALVVSNNERLRAQAEEKRDLIRKRITTLGV